MRSTHLRVASDQAVALRKLVRDARAADEPATEAGGGVIVVAGAKGGVGTTTLSLRLAEAFADEGPTTVVDANLRQADLAQVAAAEVEGAYDLADVFAGVARTDDALIAVRENLGLLPGAWAPAAQPDASIESVGRWLEELKRLSYDGAAVVVDAGVGMKPWTEPLWRAAKRVVLVTTPDNVAVLNAYATTKLARGEGVTTPLDLLVNRAADLASAAAVHARVESTCQKFLRESISFLGWTPDDADVGAPGVRERSFGCTVPWRESLQAHSLHH